MNTPAFRRLAFLLPALLGLAPLHAQREKLPMEDLEIVEKKWPEAKRTYTGLRYIILKPGDVAGPSPEKGMEVSVLYKGMLIDGTCRDLVRCGINFRHGGQRGLGENRFRS